MSCKSSWRGPGDSLKHEGSAIRFAGAALLRRRWTLVQTFNALPHMELPGLGLKARQSGRTCVRLSLTSTAVQKGVSPALQPGSCARLPPFVVAVC